MQRVAATQEPHALAHGSRAHAVPACVPINFGINGPALLRIRRRLHLRTLCLLGGAAERLSQLGRTLALAGLALRARLARLACCRTATSAESFCRRAL